MFTQDSVEFDDATRILDDVAAAIGASSRILPGRTRFPMHRRIFSLRGEFILVDCVLDTAPAIVSEKRTWGDIRYDSLQDLAANKISAYYDRCEFQDLIDLFFVVKAGVSLPDLVASIRKKNPALRPEVLAYRIRQERWDRTWPRLLVDHDRNEIRERLHAIADEIAIRCYPGNR